MLVGKFELNAEKESNLGRIELNLRISSLKMEIRAVL